MIFIALPRGLRQARNQSAHREFPKTNSAEIEVAHIAVFAAAAPATVDLTRAELRGALSFYD
ncbi:MAG: hypothetical protein A2722_01480 [Candidatus Doudnabacteria bacterium RIFCSPHIGHO2_01_FULL_50_11]|uniref:Uncharacterized protein n=1 Tax=Candidatus Doudnabacteria bacterium RIFCSPHIGHO2_01_FULL_50_11 TaxID=1817828 RepID=A0A1F5PMX7_9BACT|nr:MAG: hypothetical protein A2722_01480 [Candidatus Doudnabacteria bacterium RIFCSPHIGHO2_01_FULL_50_11]